MSTDYSPMAAAHNAAQPICSLPQKVLDTIAKAVAARGRKQRYPYPHIDEQARFTAAAEDIMCMALTCKAFLSSAQKEFYRYPVITDDWDWAKPFRRMERRVELAETLECDFQPTHSIYLFVRTLMAHPDLAKLVEHFRLELTEYHLYYYGVEPPEPWTTEAPIRLSPEEQEDCLRAVDGCFAANRTRQLMWKYDLEQYWYGTWAGVALALFPNVDSITLGTDVSGKRNRVHSASPFKALFGGYLQLYHRPDPTEKSPYIEVGVVPSEIPISLAGMATVAAFRSMTSLRIEVCAPADFEGIGELSALKVLDLYLYPSGTRTYFAAEENLVETAAFSNARIRLRCVRRTLRLCNVRTVLELSYAYVRS